MVIRERMSRKSTKGFLDMGCFSFEGSLCGSGIEPRPMDDDTMQRENPRVWKTQISNLLYSHRGRAVNTARKRQPRRWKTRAAFRLDDAHRIRSPYRIVSVIQPDPVSLTTHHVHLGRKDTGAIISSATGFIYRRGDQHFLITNWHVVTGTNAQTGV